MMEYDQHERVITMGETILLVLVLLLALVGCTQLIRWAAVRLLEPAEKDAGIQVVPLEGGRSDLEYVIRAAVVQCRWSRRPLRPGRLVLLDVGLDADGRQLAESLCREAAVELWSPGELREFFQTRLQHAGK